MPKRKIVYFTSPNCTPCEEVTRLIQEGAVDAVDVKEIEVVDIETDEGFARFNREVLSKGESGVPHAIADGKACEIEIHDDSFVVFNCPKDGPLSSPSEKSSPPASSGNKSAS